MKLQIPTDVPNPSQNTPIDITSVFDIVLFIVAPILLIVFYILLRRKKKTAKMDEQ
ncbi:MAG: adenylosuccinate synthetase [Flavobacteriaceae bacterium]